MVDIGWHGKTRCMVVTKTKKSQKERLLAEAKSKVLRHEYRADLAEINIRELNRQIESQRMEIGHALTGYEQSRREQDLLHKELTKRERALRETCVRNSHEMEELKRAHELSVNEFLIGKLTENEHTTNELMAKKTAR